LEHDRAIKGFFIRFFKNVMDAARVSDLAYSGDTIFMRPTLTSCVPDKKRRKTLSGKFWVMHGPGDSACF
jgi:hypothetical protein